MKRLKKPLLFSLAVLPVAAVGGYFTVLYQMELYDPAVFAEAIAQVGGMEVLLAISVVQVAMYTAFCGIFGYILAEKTGLMKRIRMEKEALLPA